MFLVLLHTANGKNIIIENLHNKKISKSHENKAKLFLLLKVNIF